MSDISGGIDPWLAGEPEYKQPPNPANVGDRNRTWGIRPDLFDSLNKVMPKKATIDELLKQAQDRLEDSKKFLAMAEDAQKHALASLQESERAT
ncbi:TPA: hypothetical protein JAJ85_002124, partial [Corynebacterium striatum]|nr:hypothetical protein [Corynebacterium striatum]